MVSGLLVEIHTIHLLDSLQSYRYYNLFDTRNGVSRSIKISRAVIHLTKLPAPEKFIDLCRRESFKTEYRIAAALDGVQMYRIATAPTSPHVKYKISAVV